MHLVTPKCPDCGAALRACEPGESVTCAYCGSTVVVAGADEAPDPSAPHPAPAPSGAQVKCPECGHLNQPHYKFCLGCGALL
jgi:DNA-directed RNA polymerase subunit RPC12/RpoP